MSDELTKISEAEYNQRLDNPNKQEALGFINDYMSGKIAVVPEEELASGAEPVVASLPVSEGEGTESTPEQFDDQIGANTEVPTVDPIEEERRMLREEIAKHQKAREEEVAKARKEREELLAIQRERDSRIKQMEEDQARYREQATVKPVVAAEDDEDLSFASEATVKTRKMVEDLSSKVQKLSNTDFRQAPEYKELQQLLEAQREQQRLEAERKVKEDAERKTKLLFDEIRKVQEEVPEELKTETPIEDLDRQVVEFQKQLASTFGAANRAQAELLVKEYVDGTTTKSEAMRKKIQALGITPPKEIEKYVRINALVDMRNGYELDSITGEYKQIKDEFGQAVRYRNVAEAYKISSYYDRISKARVEASKELQQKLGERQSSAVTLGSQSSNIDSAETMTESRVMDIINMSPGEYRNAMRNPESAAIVTKAWRAAGLEPPSIGY